MTYKNINIFISSTFNDMQSERDYIRKYIVPKLEKQLAEFHVSVQVTDLRWGVDTQSVDENERESKVLHVCLDAIQNSRPYFIALLGERYGWVPSFERINNIKRTLNPEQQSALGDISKSLSVTEMEILIGALGKHDLMPHSFFCFRKFESYEGMSEDKKREYIDAMSSDEQIRQNAVRLSQLKTRIKEECKRFNMDHNIIDYTAKWNESIIHDGVDKNNKTTGKFEGLEFFGDQLFEFIYNDVISNIESEDTASLSQLRGTEKGTFLSFVSSHSINFQGRKNMIGKIMTFFLNTRELSSVLNGETGYFLIGFSGCGKSSLFAVLYQELKEISTQYSFYILAHAAGISQKSVQVEQMLESWCMQMKESLGDVITEEKTDEEYSYKRTDRILSEFKTLLTRIQAKGLFPIVLIDSLDSFEDCELLQNFNFLPKDIPLFCTTLPGHAEKLTEKYPCYKCHHMDDFSIDDAHSVIHSVLKKNFKELPSALQEQLLNITNTKGEPAYNSPLWLRMALDILMELGEEDFNKIHKIRHQKEDVKICDYLSHVINELPAEPGQLFNYFIELSCHYFNSELTRQALTYIAVAQYGIKENDMAELISKDWDPLNFKSLQYWMHDFIQCNNNDHRWFFTHSILRQTIVEKDPKLLEQCQTKFFNFLLKDLFEGDEELQELIHQIIIRQDCKLLHTHLKKLHREFVHSFIREFCINKECVLRFIYQYINLYYIEGSELINDVEHKLFLEGNNLEESLYTKTAIDLSDYHLSLFKENDFSENIEVYENYFLAQSAKSDYIEYMEADEPYLTFFEPLITIYERMKNDMGENKIPWTLSYSFFSYWRTYIYKLQSICEHEKSYHEQYVESLSNYIEENALWYCVHNDIPEDFFKSTMDLINDERHLSIDERISLLQVTQRMALRMIKSLDENKEDYTIIVRAVHPLINSYVDLFDKKDDFYKTALMEYLSYFPQPTENMQSTHEHQILNDLPDENVINIKFTDLPPNGGKNDEWITIDSDDLSIDPDSFMRMVGKRTDDEEDNMEFNYIEGVPTEEQIKGLEASLDVLLKTENHDRNLSRKEVQQDFPDKVQLYRRLAMMYLQVGQTEKSNNLIRQLSLLFTSFIVNMNDNYAIDDIDSQGIIDHGNWLAKLGRSDEQLKQAEMISEALFQSYYHHENGNSQRRIFNYLLNLYDEYGLKDKKIMFLQHMFEIILRNHIERMFRTWHILIPDLGYVRPIFNKLFEELRSSHRIKDAVVELERWVKICHRQYLDVEDTDGYRDLDNSYDMLASLYDGTPSLVEGMKERNSMFLNDPYIMVCQDEKWGYINHEGQVVIPLIFSRAWKAEQTCLSVCYNGKWGYLDLQGNELPFLGKINFQLDVAVPIKNNWGRICIDDDWAEFHVDSNQLDHFSPIKIDCDRFHDITDGFTKVNVKTSGYNRQNILLNDGETLLFEDAKYSIKTPNKGVIIADWYNPNEEDNDGHHSALYDMQGKELTQKGRYVDMLAFGEQDITAVFRNDSHAGFINRSGEEISSFEYRRSRPFSYGRGAVCKDGTYKYGRWGFVNEQGEETIKPQYIDVGDFHEGLAWVCMDCHSRKGFGCRGGKFGFINTQGEMIIPPIYDDVSSFFEGRALVWKNGHAIYINHDGEIIDKSLTS